MVANNSIVKLRTRKLKNGNSAYFLDYSLNGKRVRDALNLTIVKGTTKKVREANAYTKRVAEAICRQKEKDILSGKIGTTDFVNNSKVTLVAWLAHVADEKLRTGQSKSNAVTIQNIIHHLDQYQGGTCDITMAKVDKYFCLGFVDYLKTARRLRKINESSTANKYLSKSTANLYFNTLTMVLNEAVRENIIPINPINQIKREEKKPIRPKGENRTFLTIDELKILAATDCGNEMVKKAFMFACFSGLRISDIISLKWNDFVHDGERQVINKTMQKTQRAIYLPLPNDALKWLPMRGKARMDAAVFTLPKNTTINADIKSWAKRAGIKKNLCFHVSRHTYATTLLTKGADLYTTSKLLGHQNLRTTQIYAEIVNEKKVSAVDLLDNIL